MEQRIPCSPASTAQPQRAPCRTPQPPFSCLRLRVGVRSRAAHKAAGRHTCSCHHGGAASALNTQQCAAAERRRAKASRKHASTTNTRRARALETRRAVQIRATNDTRIVTSSYIVIAPPLHLPTLLRLLRFSVRGRVSPPRPGYACRLPRRRCSAACAERREQDARAS